MPISVWLFHQVTADASSDPRRGGLDGIAGEMGIAGGRLDLGVSQELADHCQALTESQSA